MTYGRGQAGQNQAWSPGAGLRRGSVQWLADDAQDAGRVSARGAGRLLHQEVLASAHPAQSLLEEADGQVAARLIQVPSPAQRADVQVKEIGVRRLLEVDGLIGVAVEDPVAPSNPASASWQREQGNGELRHAEHRADSRRVRRSGPARAQREAAAGRWLYSRSSAWWMRPDRRRRTRDPGYSAGGWGSGPEAQPH